MATGHQGLKKVGRFWHYSLKVNGQRVHGSTRATDLPTARAVMEDKRKELLNGQIKRSSRIVTVRELVNEWLAVHKTIFSKGHLASAECALRRWVLPKVGGLPIKGLNTQEATSLRTHMLEGGCSPTYANNIFRTLKAICHYGIRVHYLHSLPFLLPKLKVQRKPRPVVPVVRMQDFFAALDQEARNPHIPVLIRVMVGLGLRESEALGLRWEWFSDHRTYSVGRTKNRLPRTLPVPEWLWDAIHAMPKSLSGWVFPAEDGNPHRAQFTKKVLQRVCHRLGLGNITPHRLRATFASIHASEAKTPITELRQLLGHRCLTTTALYCETSLEVQRKAQDTMSERLGFSTEQGNPAAAV